MSSPRPARGARSGRHRRGAIVTAAVGVVMVALVLGGSGAGAAAASTAVSGTPADGTPALGRTPTQDEASGVDLQLDALTPRVVTSDGAPELFVTGRIVNRSASTVRDLGVRVQRGGALTGARDTSAALAGTGGTDAVAGSESTPGSANLPTQVAAGGLATFTMRVPLRGPSSGSLALTSSGIYPLLVSARGIVGSGETTRLGTIRVLLPVVGLPGGAPVPGRPAGRATQVSVLYPLADRPRRLPVVPGAPTLLGDDELATSFAPGGRLSGLVDALARSAPPGSSAAGAVCLAVDGDLLDTAAAMAGGYQVQTPDGPVPGRGAGAAAGWLAAVRTQAAGRCVIALPFADTDVVATSRSGAASKGPGDLTTDARIAGAQRVGQLLGVPPLPDATWPADGRLDDGSLADLSSGGARTLVLDADSLDAGIPSGGVARMTGVAGQPPTAVVTDPVAAAALGPHSTSGSGTGGSVSPADTSAPLATQDALGVLALRAIQSVPGRPNPAVTVLAPPRRWAASGAEASALLDSVSDLTRRGLLRPVDAGALASRAADPALPSASLAEPARGGTPTLSSAAVTRAQVVRDHQRALVAASERDRVGTATPADFFAPLSEGVMRGLSASWRGDPAGEDAAMSAVEHQTADLGSMVRVVQPSGSYALGSNDAPLPLTVENQLPVAVHVQVVIEPTQGLRARPPAEDLVPAFSSRQFPVGIEVVRSGQFTVDAQARTPAGEPLGPTAHLLLRSTAYGTITVWLTTSAAVALVILASVRITRRVRASRATRRRHRPGARTTTTTESDPGPGDHREEPQAHGMPDPSNRPLQSQ